PLYFTDPDQLVAQGVQFRNRCKRADAPSLEQIRASGPVSTVCALQQTGARDWVDTCRGRAEAGGGDALAVGEDQQSRSFELGKFGQRCLARSQRAVC